MGATLNNGRLKVKSGAADCWLVGRRRRREIAASLRLPPTLSRPVGRREWHDGWHDGGDGSGLLFFRLRVPFALGGGGAVLAPAAREPVVALAQEVALPIGLFVELVFINFNWLTAAV